MLRLTYLTANAAYVFTFGDQLMRMLDHPMFFESRQAAVDAAREARLGVSRSGVVSAI